MAGDGLDFWSELGYAKHGLSVPFLLCFFGVMILYMKLGYLLDSSDYQI
jgi:hypothetical protein